MITETGKVVGIKGDQAWVQTIRTSACQSCSARSGCGQRALASVSGGRANQILVDNPVGARVGDEVEIGIDEQSLLRASLAVYGVPMALMIAATVWGYQVWGTDLAAVLGALGGLAGGFLAVRRWQSRAGAGYQPRLLRVSRIASVTCL